MNEEKNFAVRNELNAERAALMSGLSANTSPIGDWKIAKIYEARLRGQEDPYDLEALCKERDAARLRLNEIQMELAALDGTEPTEAELLALSIRKKQTAITEHDNSANVNSFIIGGLPMWLGFELRQRLTASLSAIEADGGTEMTKTFGGIDYTFTTERWRMMLAVVENYAGDCQKVTEGHRNTVAALKSVAEVEAYDHTVGYPEKINFDVLLASGQTQE